MVPNPELTSSEIAVLESLHDATEAVSQRELARRAGISVGLVNAVLKRLVHTGYVKTSRLDRRSLEYLLTPEGFAQTALRSYHYIVDTVRSFRSIKERLVSLVSRLRAEGVAEFYLYGEGDLAGLVAVFLEEEGLGPITRGLPPADARRRGIIAVLNAEPRPLRSKGARVIELLEEFSNGSSQQQAKKGKNSTAARPGPGSKGSAGHEGTGRHFERIEEFYGGKKEPM
ncbi:MAG: MarR family transcriptional regulator [bacterium]